MEAKSLHTFMTAKDAGERGSIPPWKSATYNGYIKPEQVLGTWQTLQQRIIRARHSSHSASATGRRPNQRHA